MIFKAKPKVSAGYCTTDNSVFVSKWFFFTVEPFFLNEPNEAAGKWDGASELLKSHRSKLWCYTCQSPSLAFLVLGFTDGVETFKRNCLYMSNMHKVLIKQRLHHVKSFCSSSLSSVRH